MTREFESHQDRRNICPVWELGVVAWGAGRVWSPAGQATRSVRPSTCNTLGQPRDECMLILAVFHASVWLGREQKDAIEAPGH